MGVYARYVGCLASLTYSSARAWNAGEQGFVSCRWRSRAGVAQGRIRNVSVTSGLSRLCVSRAFAVTSRNPYRYHSISRGRASSSS